MKLINHAGLFLKIVQANITKQWLPLIVSLTVTNRCNLRCIYCYGSYYNRNIQDYPTNIWLNLVDDLASLGTKLIHLEGGEPLLRNDIGDLIDYIKNAGMICRMNSNGLLVPKNINKLKGLDSLCISLDGDPEANNENRGQGTYEKILDGIICYCIQLYVIVCVDV